MFSLVFYLTISATAASLFGMGELSVEEKGGNEAHRGHAERHARWGRLCAAHRNRRYVCVLNLILSNVQYTNVTNSHFN